ncbi:ASPIC/UnbV domain-containing protein [Verrucomicrobiales bacterium]|nr:ASPIC/UnbV domain-containing protein [Verrucomicrobiales bacterium]MDC0048596.1 ASPIC/UnbV domain-containing protein [Verrucomicrobiota bacterium]
MRSDESLSEQFRNNESWGTDPRTGKVKPSQERLTYYYGPNYHRHSYSGYERNKFYLNVSGETFADLSGVSGADDVADSRTWAALDYDKDGWTDIALVNANAPLLSLYRNTIGEIKKSNHIKILLVGGADGKDPGKGLSNKDGVGAVVEVVSGDRLIKRVRKLGDGYASQNSSTMTIGIGSEITAQSIKVRWPSGKITMSQSPIKAGSMIVMKEIQ